MDALMINDSHYMAFIFSRYNACSDWLILLVGNYSPVTPTGGSRVCIKQSKISNNKQLIKSLKAGVLRNMHNPASFSENSHYNTTVFKNG